jgi:hypothetical protein
VSNGEGQIYPSRQGQIYFPQRRFLGFPVQLVVVKTNEKLDKYLIREIAGTGLIESPRRTSSGDAAGNEPDT